MNSMFEVNQHDSEYIDQIERLSVQQPSKDSQDDPLAFSATTTPPFDPALPLSSPAKRDSSLSTKIKEDSGLQRAEKDGNLRRPSREGKPGEADDWNYFDHYDEDQENEDKTNIINEIYQQHVLGRYESQHKQSLQAYQNKMASLNKQSNSFLFSSEKDSVGNFSSSEPIENQNGLDFEQMQQMLPFQKKFETASFVPEEFQISSEALQEGQNYLQLVYSLTAKETQNVPRISQEESPKEELQKTTVKNYLDQLYRSTVFSFGNENERALQFSVLAKESKIDLHENYLKGIYEQLIEDYFKASDFEFLMRTISKANAKPKDRKLSEVNEIIDQVVGLAIGVVIGRERNRSLGLKQERVRMTCSLKGGCTGNERRETNAFYPEDYFNEMFDRPIIVCNSWPKIPSSSFLTLAFNKRSSDMLHFNLTDICNQYLAKVESDLLEKFGLEFMKKKISGISLSQKESSAVPSNLITKEFNPETQEITLAAVLDSQAIEKSEIKAKQEPVENLLALGSSEQKDQPIEQIESGQQKNVPDDSKPETLKAINKDGLPLNSGHFAEFVQHKFLKPKPKDSDVKVRQFEKTLFEAIRNLTPVRSNVLFQKPAEDPTNPANSPEARNPSAQGQSRRSSSNCPRDNSKTGDSTFLCDLAVRKSQTRGSDVSELRKQSLMELARKKSSGENFSQIKQNTVSNFSNPREKQSLTENEEKMHIKFKPEIVEADFASGNKNEQVLPGNLQETADAINLNQFQSQNDNQKQPESAKNSFSAEKMEKPAVRINSNPPVYLEIRESLKVKFLKSSQPEEYYACMATEEIAGRNESSNELPTQFESELSNSKFKKKESQIKTEIIEPLENQIGFENNKISIGKAEDSFNFGSRKLIPESKKSDSQIIGMSNSKRSVERIELPKMPSEEQNQQPIPDENESCTDQEAKNLEEEQRTLRIATKIAENYRKTLLQNLLLSNEDFKFAVEKENLEDFQNENRENSVPNESPNFENYENKLLANRTESFEITENPSFSNSEIVKRGSDVYYSRLANALVEDVNNFTLNYQNDQINHASGIKKQMQQNQAEDNDFGPSNSNLSKQKSETQTAINETETNVLPAKITLSKNPENYNSKQTDEEKERQFSQFLGNTPQYFETTQYQNSQSNNFKSSPEQEYYTQLVRESLKVLDEFNQALDNVTQNEASGRLTIEENKRESLAVDSTENRLDSLKTSKEVIPQIDLNTEMNADDMKSEKNDFKGRQNSTFETQNKKNTASENKLNLFAEENVEIENNLMYGSGLKKSFEENNLSAFFNEIAEAHLNELLSDISIISEKRDSLKTEQQQVCLDEELNTNQIAAFYEKANKSSNSVFKNQRASLNSNQNESLPNEEFYSRQSQKYFDQLLQEAIIIHENNLDIDIPPETAARRISDVSYEGQSTKRASTKHLANLNEVIEEPKINTSRVGSFNSKEMNEYHSQLVDYLTQEGHFKEKEQELIPLERLPEELQIEEANFAKVKERESEAGLIEKEKDVLNLIRPEENDNEINSKEQDLYYSQLIRNMTEQLNNSNLIFKNFENKQEISRVNSKANQETSLLIEDDSKQNNGSEIKNDELEIFNKQEYSLAIRPSEEMQSEIDIKENNFVFETDVQQSAQTLEHPEVPIKNKRSVSLLFSVKEQEEYYKNLIDSLIIDPQFSHRKSSFLHLPHQTEQIENIKEITDFHKESIRISAENNPEQNRSVRSDSNFDQHIENKNSQLSLKSQGRISEFNNSKDLSEKNLPENQSRSSRLSIHSNNLILEEIPEAQKKVSMAEIKQTEENDLDEKIEQELNQKSNLLERTNSEEKVRKSSPVRIKTDAKEANLIHRESRFSKKGGPLAEQICEGETSKKLSDELNVENENPNQIRNSSVQKQTPFSTKTFEEKNEDKSNDLVKSPESERISTKSTASNIESLAENSTANRPTLLLCEPSSSKTIEVNIDNPNLYIMSQKNSIEHFDPTQRGQSIFAQTVAEEQRKTTIGANFSGNQKRPTFQGSEQEFEEEEEKNLGDQGNQRNSISEKISANEMLNEFLPNKTEKQKEIEPEISETTNFQDESNQRNLKAQSQAKNKENDLATNEEFRSEIKSQTFSDRIQIDKFSNASKKESQYEIHITELEIPERQSADLLFDLPRISSNAESRMILLKEEGLPQPAKSNLDVGHLGVFTRKNSLELEDRHHRQTRITRATKASILIRKSVIENDSLTTSFEESEKKGNKNVARPVRLMPEMDDDTRLRLEMEYKLQVAQRMNQLLSKGKFASREETERLLREEMKRMVSIDFLFFVNCISQKEKNLIIRVQQFIRNLINKRIANKINENTKLLEVMRQDVEIRKTRLTGLKYVLVAG